MAKPTMTPVRFLVLNVIAISISFYIAFIVHRHYLKGADKKDNTFLDWFNQGKITPRSLLVSLMFGIVFGFMDNFFMWIGVEKMMSFIPGGTLTKGAWGNTYSDLIGATLGAAVARIGQDIFNTDPTPPIWINAIAMPIGCVIGMFAGKALTGGD